MTAHDTSHLYPSTTVLAVLFGTLLAIAVSGLLLYVLVIAVVFTRRRFANNSYFYIAAWLGVAECICLVLMIAYAAPCILMRRNLSDSKIIGGILNIGWFTGLPLIVVLAVNRYLCMCKNNYFKEQFTIQKSKIYCIVCWLFGIIYSMPSFFNCCPLYFDYQMMSWGWSVTDAGAKMLGNGELAMVILVIIVVFGLNGQVFRLDINYALYKNII